ncbi:MAG: hypothetical protein H0V81_11895 [Solirubrobacterales bacterium]|nr:hypothetical protein [Solirubrobacterales bacterium]
MSNDEQRRGLLSRAAGDVANNVSSVALLAFASVLFFSGAIAGVGLVSRLGGAGWFMYALVIGTYALIFGPVIAWAVTLRQNGSPRHRAAVEKRRQQQRLKYGLDALEAKSAMSPEERTAMRQEELRRRAARSGARDAASRTMSPNAVTNGPTDGSTSSTNPGRPSPGGENTR